MRPVVTCTVTPVGVSCMTRVVSVTYRVRTPAGTSQPRRRSTFCGWLSDRQSHSCDADTGERTSDRCALAADRAWGSRSAVRATRPRSCRLVAESTFASWPGADPDGAGPLADRPRLPSDPG